MRRETLILGFGPFMLSANCRDTLRSVEMIGEGCISDSEAAGAGFVRG